MKTINELFNDAALGRLYKKEELDKTMVCLTAFRRDLSLEENRERNEKVECILRSAGYGFNKIIGHYGGVIEESFCAIDSLDNPERLKKVALKIGRMFGQDEIFYGCLDGQNYLININTSNEKELNIVLSTSEITELYSAIKGEDYVLENVTNYTDYIRGMGGAMLRSLYSKLIEGTYEDFVYHQENNVKDIDEK